MTLTVCFFCPLNQWPTYPLLASTETSMNQYRGVTNGLLNGNMECILLCVKNEIPASNTALYIITTIGQLSFGKYSDACTLKPFYNSKSLKLVGN